MKIAVLAGDGIGPEIISEALKVLKALPVYGSKFIFEAAPVGAAALRQIGHPLPESTLRLARDSDAVLFGSVGYPVYDRLERSLRPEQAILGLRKNLELFANLRPAILFPELSHVSPLRDELVRGTDLMIVRELNGDIYFGQPKGYVVNQQGHREGYDTMRYSAPEVARIAHLGFKLARQRKKKVTSVDKSNVLDAMQLWRDVVTEVGAEYPDVALEHMYVDNAAMQLIRRPTQFDVILTGNMFGDILSDEAAMLTGSIGMLPSASLGATSFGLYEPGHGSAPDIAGQMIANPLATILSAAMMLRHSFGLENAAGQIEAAVRKALQQGYRTGDIWFEGNRKVGTQEMGNAIVAAL